MEINVNAAADAARDAASQETAGAQPDSKTDKRQGRQQSQPARAERKPAGNSLAAVLGAATFRLVENPRWYPDKYNKGKENQRVAHAEFTVSGEVVITGSIYFEKEIAQDSEGRKEQTFMRFSPPKGVSLGKGATADEFKESILDQFEAFKASLKDGATLGKTKSTAGRRAI